MSESYWNIQFLNANAQRAYPLTQAATKLDTSGTFEIPNDFILGVYLPVHAGLNVQPHKFYISSIAIFSAGVRITISYDDGGSGTIVATAAVPRSTHTEYAEYTLVGQGDFEDTHGRIVIGSLNAIAALPAGAYEFNWDGAQLEVDGIWPMIQYVSGLVFVNNGQRSARLVGDVEIVAGSRLRFTTADVDTPNPKVRWDVIDGENLNQDCECTDVLGTPIRTINGEPPTPAGDFTLASGDCIELMPTTHGLTLKNTCAKPCCDCPELRNLTDELKFFGSEARTVDGFVRRLQSLADTTTNVILGSTLNDESCIECS